mmetsp:Transcript_20606/g.43564  ORF Transcript_20606/g.43564 Transcript_20606/m.43564 type:complete len:318 (+) Transcript_20606:118-1071(+)
MILQNRLGGRCDAPLSESCRSKGGLDICRGRNGHLEKALPHLGPDRVLGAPAAGHHARQRAAALLLQQAVPQPLDLRHAFQHSLQEPVVFRRPRLEPRRQIRVRDGEPLPRLQQRVVLQARCIPEVDLGAQVGKLLVIEVLSEHRAARVGGAAGEPEVPPELVAVDAVLEAVHAPPAEHLHRQGAPQRGHRFPRGAGPRRQKGRDGIRRPRRDLAPVADPVLAGDSRRHAPDGSGGGHDDLGKHVGEGARLHPARVVPQVRVVSELEGIVVVGHAGLVRALQEQRGKPVGLVQEEEVLCLLVAAGWEKAAVLVQPRE